MPRFKSLEHSKWDCTYHIVWIPKYRRKALHGKARGNVVSAIKQWCQLLGVEIVEGRACADHIQLCLATLPKYSVSRVVGLLKGKSASVVMSQGGRQQRIMRGRQFWARGYCVSTVGLDEKTNRQYIRNQEDEDRGQGELPL